MGRENVLHCIFIDRRQSKLEWQSKLEYKTKKVIQNLEKKLCILFENFENKKLRKSYGAFAKFEKKNWGP